jgi:archaellum component FlaC
MEYMNRDLGYLKDIGYDLNGTVSYMNKTTVETLDEDVREMTETTKNVSKNINRFINESDKIIESAKNVDSFVDEMRFYFRIGIAALIIFSVAYFAILLFVVIAFLKKK